MLDCRGFAAKPDLSGLRGVKGEMMVVRSSDVKLTRPVRMLHPRHPVYVVPRPDGTFMIGATMIENEERARVTAQSLVELVNSAFAIHPAFAEAEVVETGSDVRPSFRDNLPRIRREGRQALSQRPLPPRFPAVAGSRQPRRADRARRRFLPGGHG